MPRVKVVPVTSVTFYRDVAFTTVRCNEHDRGVGLSSSRSSRRSAVSGGGNEPGAVLRGLCLNCIGRTDQVWVLSSAGTPAMRSMSASQTYEATMVSTHPCPSAPVLQPRSVQAFAPAGLTTAADPINAKLAGFDRGRALLLFFSRTIPSLAICLASVAWLPATLGAPVPPFQLDQVTGG